MPSLMPRQNWIDWMKAFGMVIIVWGHCFPTGLTPFIYAFSVPVFFLVSGYLTRHEASNGVFWSKVFWTLIVPYLILVSLKVAGYWLKHLDDGGALYSVAAILTGVGVVKDFSTALPSISGCGNLWYVYALVLMKIIFQYCSRSRYSIIVVTGICIVLQLLFVKLVPHDNYSWALPAAFGAMPFFVLGHCLSPKCALTSENFKLRMSSSLEAAKRSDKRYVLLFLVIVLFAITASVSHFNGEAWMYRGEYGNSLILFYIAALTGSAAVVCLSLMLDAIRSRLVSYISIGTLVILTFHRDVMHPLLKIIDKQQFDMATNGMLTLLASIGVTLVFVPVILFLKRFLPIVLGKRSV